MVVYTLEEVENHCNNPIGGQALFRAIGFKGVSEPEEIEDVEEGESLGFVTKPRGKPDPLVAGERLPLASVGVVDMGETVLELVVPTNPRLLE